MVQQTSIDSGSIAAFMTLQILGGHVGMGLILATIFFSRNIVRHPVFVNFCVGWMLFALSYSFLLYTGQIANTRPNFNLCLTQAAMSYAAPVMGATSVFVFTLHLYLILKQSVGELPAKHPRLRMILMIAAPYMAYLLMFVIALFFGYFESKKVVRSKFYCTMDVGRVTRTAAALSAAAILAALVVEVLTVITVQRHWKSFRRGKTGVTVSILVRTFIVLLVSFLALLTCMAFLADLQGEVPNFVIACLPISAFLTFGTQTDFLQTWFFCCLRKTGHRRTASSSSSSIGTSSAITAVDKEAPSFLAKEHGSEV